MADDKYLFLLRWSGEIPDSAATVGVQLARILTSIIRGDSLDTPFINFIPVTSISHSIGGIKDEKSYSDLKEASDARNLYFARNLTNESKADWSKKLVESRGANGALEGLKLESSMDDANVNNDWRWSGGTPMAQPGALVGSLPDQKLLKFKKRLDSATPQLAYGCSIQEQYKIALFYFRRKVGFGVSAVPFPYLVVGLENVVIRNWDLDGDSETCTLSYDRICWGGISQWADTPVPQGISVRFFDRTSGSGGMVQDSALCAFVPIFTAALYGAAWAALTASSSDDDNLDP